MVNESNSSKFGYRGYTTHRSFGGLRIPVQVQNLVMRDYAGRNDMTFMLSINEFDFHDCYVQLKKLVKQATSLEGGMMCSLFMLPPDSDTRLDIYRDFIRNESSLHFVLENVVVSNAQDIEDAEEIIHMRQILDQSPKEFPLELVPALKGMEEFTFQY